MAFSEKTGIISMLLYIVFFTLPAACGMHTSSCGPGPARMTPSVQQSGPEVWVYNVNYKKENTVCTIAMAGQEKINGINSYITEASFDKSPIRYAHGKRIEIKGVKTWWSTTSLDVQREKQEMRVMRLLNMTSLATIRYWGADHGAPFSRGKSWSFARVRSVDPPMTKDKRAGYDARVQGAENVTVPAGTFDCYKVTYRRVSLDGKRVDPLLLKTEWWAKDCGLTLPVKVINVGSYDATETRELVSAPSSSATSLMPEKKDAFAHWKGGRFVDESTGFSITLPGGWTMDAARRKKRDDFFHRVKDMGLVAKGIEVKQDMGCPGFFVSPHSDSYVEVHWAKSPIAVEPQVAFTYTNNAFYHQGYRRIGDPVIDPETKNLAQIYTCDDGKAKEVMTVRPRPPEIWIITCMAFNDKSFDTYEPVFDRIIRSFSFMDMAAPGATTAERESGPFRISVMPYLQNVKKTGITIMWETSRAADARVAYGPEIVSRMGEEFMIESKYTGKAKSDQKSWIHEITLSGLKAGTVYHYKVASRLPSGKEVRSEYALFKTAPHTGAPITFAVYGDSRCAIDCTHWDTHNRIAQGMDARRPDFVVNTGDVVLDGRDHKRWLEEFFRPAKELFQDTPVYVSIGNHEVNSHWYYDFFSDPEPEDYYAFDYGNAHFVILDCFEHIDSETNWKVIGPGSSQYHWLVKDLASSKTRWKFVFFHIPIYDSSSDFDPSAIQLRRTLAPVFEKYGVDIVFNGHDHNYERSYPMKNGRIDLENGLLYITTGGGGAELHRFSEKKARYIAEGLVVHHYCIIEISGGHLEMKVYDVDGKLIDCITVTKGPVGS